MAAPLRPASVMLALFICLIFHKTSYSQTTKRYYIGIDDHTDYMWAGDEAQYDTAYVHVLDYYLRKIDSTKHFPDNQQIRFICDGSYWLKTYAKFRPAKKFDELIAAIRSGHISSPLTELVNCYGAQPTEAVLRGMYYAGHLERQFHLRFSLANAMENNTQPLGLAALWSGAGAKYNWKGAGGYGSQLTEKRRANRQYQLYRALGPDSTGVITKWYSTIGKNYGALGGYAECRLTLKKGNPDSNMVKVIGYMDAFSRDSNYPYNAVAAFGYGHDDLSSFIADPYISVAKQLSNRQRFIRISNAEDFFHDIEKNYKYLPGQSVTFGNEWDILSASMNETTAKVRRATEKLRSAEALAALAVLIDPAFAKELEPKRDLAWDSFGMYWEHNWTGDGPVSQAKRAAWQNKLQHQISDYVDTLQERAILHLGKQIRKAHYPRFFIFNSLSWVRDACADVRYDGSPVTVIDLTSHQPVFSQLCNIDGEKFLRIAAIKLPALGYKVYEIRPSSKKKHQLLPVIKDGEISNAYYKIRLTPSGAITSIYDKISHRELVMRTDNRYLNDLGSAQIYSGEPIIIENFGPVSCTYKATSREPLLHTTRVTLFNHKPGIFIENTIDTNFKDVKVWSFSMRLHNPTTRYEELGAVITAKKFSEGGDYADRNARYDWQTFNHFADLSEPNYGVTVSNADCSFFKLGRSTPDTLCAYSAQINALAGGRVDRKREDNGALGIANQNGETSFHYSFAILPHPGKGRPLNSMRFALAHQNSPVTGWVTGGIFASQAPLGRLLTTSNQNVLVWAVKPAESTAGGLTVRFWNLSSMTAHLEVGLSNHILTAFHTTHIESIIKPLKLHRGKVPISIPGKAISTILITSR